MSRTSQTSVAAQKKNLVFPGAPPTSDRQMLVQTETDWLRPAKPPLLANGAPARISLSRWTRGRVDSPLELIADHADDFHFITYSLIQSDIDFKVGRKGITEGTVPHQLVLLNGPTADRRHCVYHKPFDFFRIYIPQSLLAECYEAAFGRPPSQEFVLFPHGFTGDKVIEDLTRSLINVDEMGGALGPSYIDAVGLALAARMLRQYATPNSRPAEKPVSQLPRWRLKRVVEYVDARLAEPIYLQELATVAGLSRMHFAAQFRAAVGCSPHTYMARRRIAYAQQLLLGQSLPIASIATLAGFRSHAQFSSAFKKMVGTTPQQWRRTMVDSAD